MESIGKGNNNISISINPEIREYSETVFWGLTLRQFLFSLAGCVMSVGVYFALRNVFGGVLGMETISWACIIGMLPCALLGFITYNGMTAEQALGAYIRSEILTPKVLVFKPVNEIERLIAQEKEMQKSRRKWGERFEKEEKPKKLEGAEECTGGCPGTDDL